MTPEDTGFGGLTVESISPEELYGGSQLLQTGFWGRFKAASGWRPLAFRWNADTGSEQITGVLLALERRFSGGFRMAYVPYGPALPPPIAARPEQISFFLAALAGRIRQHLSSRCFVLRFDLCSGTSGSIDSDIPAAPDLHPPLRRAPYRVQPPDTVILPLVTPEGTALSEDDILAGMHKKTRYNIRLAARKGVEIQRLAGQDAVEHLTDWYRLYQETGERDGISLHPEFYYRRQFEMAGAGESSPGLSLYMASHDGDSLAGIIVFRNGSRSVYMYGASSSRKRELMPNHLLQWTAIQDALAEGASEYDFFGVPPADNPSHPMHGLWRFKTGFGGDLHHYYGAWDYPYNGFIYLLYAAAEKWRGRLAVMRKKR